MNNNNKKLTLSPPHPCPKFKNSPEKDMPNNPELSKKRKTNPTADNNNNKNFKIPMHSDDNSQENSLVLTLSLNYPPTTRHQPLPSPPPPQISLQSFAPYTTLQLSPTFPPPPPSPAPSLIAAAPRVGPTRGRRNPTQAPRDGSKSQNIPQPYPWATTTRATVHTRNYLVSNQITKITGEVQCKRCERRYEMEFDLDEKFREIATYMANNKANMHDRAPAKFMNPILPTCKFCNQENSVKPIISEKKKRINWLFLLLGQMLGCCTLEQLKYFCKHTKNHRTGAKDRVLYLTYLAICKQLQPTGPFDR